MVSQRLIGLWPKKMNKYWWFIPLLIIILFAAYLRLYNIAGYMTFLGDEGRDVLVVKRMIVDHKFTLLGPTASVGGFFLGPIYYYFMLPFLWAWRLDPVGPAIMVALFGIATVYLIFVTGKRLFGTFAGLVAASVYAVSPLVIAYSRSSWNPNVVPFFSTLLIYLLSDTKKKFLTPLLVGVTLGIGIQLHYLFLFLIVVTSIWYWRQRRAVGLTILGFLLGASPFIAFELRHGLTNTRTILQFLFTGKETGFSPATYLNTLNDVSLRLFSRLLFRMPGKEVWQDYPQWYITALSVVSQTARWIMVVWLVLRPKTLLATWVGTVLLLFGLYQRAIYDYYFGIIFAFPFLFLGTLAAWAWRRTVGRILVSSAVVALLIFNWQGRPFLFAPNNQLAQVKNIAQTAFEKSEGRPFNFALITAGNSDHAYRYFFEIWGNPPVVIENIQVDPKRDSVTDQLIVICEQLDCQPLGHPLWEVAGFGRAEITGSWEVPFVKIYRLVHYDRKD